LTPEKAMADLDCKGYTELLISEIEQIIGLKLQPKDGGDADLYEISGIPVDNITAQNDYALALAKISGKAIRLRNRK
jgi:hypothetical protein